MKTILLPIHPRHVAAIEAGTKLWEFRRRLPRLPFDRVVVYETAPTSAIVGEFSVIDVLRVGGLDRLWELTEKGAGITRWQFRCYFSLALRPSAIEIGKFTRYDHPIPWSPAPQSFRYLPSGLVEPDLEVFMRCLRWP